jgi:hypothetical protein
MCELFPKSVDGKVIQRPFHPHEKQAGLVVLVLVGVDNVGSVLIKNAGDRGDKAFAVRARDKEDGGILHSKGRQPAFYETSFGRRVV